MEEKTFITTPKGDTYYFKDAGARQLIEGKADKSSSVSNVSYDSTNKKITKTINGTTSDVVTANTLKTAMALNNVENKSSSTIRGEITSSNVTTALGYTPLNPNQKGAANGLAELDSGGKVPASQLPSYVDDVVEGYYYNNKFYKESSHTTEITGESGKIYVDLTSGSRKVYRWSGTAYAEIPIGLALGTTSSTAYRGDYGNTAYAHAVTNKGSAFSSGLYKITTNSEGHVTGAVAVAKSDITALGIPASDTNTHRPISLEGTQILGNDTTTLNLKKGSNVNITNSGGDITISATDTTYAFDGTYNASSNKAATVSTVTNAINALDGNLNNTTPSASKTLTAFSETNGIVSATFGNISITKSQVSDFPTLGAAAGKGVTDNSSSTAVTSSDTNLITGRTLYYAGYTKNAGTVTKVSTGVGLTGGDITGSGTIKANLTSETNLTNVAADGTETAGRVYPVRLDKNGKLAVNVPWTDSTNFVPTTRKVNGKALSADITLSASDVSAAPSSTVSCTKTNINSALGTGSGTVKFYREDGTWAIPEGAGSVTEIRTGAGLTGGPITTDGTISLDTSGVESGSYGPVQNVTGTEGTTINIPYISVDTYGRITNISNKVYTSKNTTYSAATQTAAGLMSSSDKTKLDGVATGATANVGTITGITMNGASKGTSGVVDLGTVITAHQDISGKVSGPSSATNNAVAIFDGTGGKAIKNSGFTIGKSVPSDAKFTDTTYSAATQSSAGLMSASDKTKLDGITSITDSEIDSLFE